MMVLLETDPFQTAAVSGHSYSAGHECPEKYAGAGYGCERAKVKG